MEFRLVSILHYAGTYYTKCGNIYAVAHIFPHSVHLRGYTHQMKLNILENFLKRLKRRREVFGHWEKSEMEPKCLTGSLIGV